MPLLVNVIVALVIGGLVLWIIEQPWVPIDGTFKQIIRTVIIVACVIWLLLILVSAFGGGGVFSFPTVRR